jgi:hypothetical protein
LKHFLSPLDYITGLPQQNREKNGREISQGTSFYVLRSSLANTAKVVHQKEVAAAGKFFIAR